MKLLTHKRKNIAPTIGVQYATHQRNINDLQICAEICKDIGVDYLSVKPVFDRGSVHEKIKKNTITKSEINQKSPKFKKKYETDNFKKKKKKKKIL